MLEINNMYDPAAPHDKGPSVAQPCFDDHETQNSCAAMAAATSVTITTVHHQEKYERNCLANDMSLLGVLGPSLYGPNLKDQPMESNSKE